MTYEEALERTINEGIEAAKEDYGRRDSPENKARLKGSIEGFEACRGKTPAELSGLLAEEGRKTHQAFIDAHEEKITSDEYWQIRCRELEIGWVANVMSAILMNQNMPVIVNPTARGVMKAAEIVGVAEAT